MNITMMRRAAEYLIRLCLLGSSKPEQIDFYPQKLHSVSDWNPPPLPELISPESVGISSAYLRSFLREFEEDEHAVIHNLLVYRDGNLISAASAPGYSPRLCSATFSMAKTVTSFAVGCLIGEGRLALDTRLVDVFPEDLPLLVSSRTKKITIRHLLTMTAGVTGVHELAACTLTDWKRAFLASSPTSTPGKAFFYNSLNSYMLAAVVEKITGRPLEDYLREHLFEPLGIRNYEIERSPEGIAKGGWGMYLTPVDMGKLGQMLLNGGVWEGRRILPAEYVMESTKSQVATPESMGDYNYGFHLWVARNGVSVVFHGMLGQHIWIRPDTKMVVVATCGNDEFYLESGTMRRIDRFFGAGFTPAASLRRAPIESVRLRHDEQNFFCLRHRLPRAGKHTDYFTTLKEHGVPYEVQSLLGEYEFEPSNVGVMPFYWRSIQNNHNPGISRVAFRVREKQLYLCLTEGTEREILCGFRSHAYTVLNYRGERYLVGAHCIFTMEENKPTLSVNMVFPEIPSSRTMKFTFEEDDTLTLSCSDIPGANMLSTLLDGVDANLPWLSAVFSIIRARMGDVAPQAVITHNLEPVVKARRYERTGNPPPVGAAEKHGFFYRMVPRNLKRMKAKLPRLPRIPNPFAKKDRKK